MALTYAGVNVTAVPSSGEYASISVESWDFKENDMKSETKAFVPEGLTVDKRYFITANGTWLAMSADASSAEPAPAPSDTSSTESPSENPASKGWTVTFDMPKSQVGYNLVENGILNENQMATLTDEVCGGEEWDGAGRHIFAYRVWGDGAEVELPWTDEPSAMKFPEVEAEFDKHGGNKGINYLSAGAYLDPDGLFWHSSSMSGCKIKLVFDPNRDGEVVTPSGRV